MLGLNKNASYHPEDDFSHSIFDFSFLQKSLNLIGKTNSLKTFSLIFNCAINTLRKFCLKILIKTKPTVLKPHQAPLKMPFHIFKRLQHLKSNATFSRSVWIIIVTDNICYFTDNIFSFSCQS